MLTYHVTASATFLNPSPSAIPSFSPSYVKASPGQYVFSSFSSPRVLCANLDVSMAADVATNLKAETFKGSVRIYGLLLPEIFVSLIMFLFLKVFLILVLQESSLLLDVDHGVRWSQSPGLCVSVGK